MIFSQSTIWKPTVTVGRMFLLAWISVAFLFNLELSAVSQQISKSRLETDLEQANFEQLFKDGSRILPAEASTLEAALRLHPNNRVAHTKLLGFYTISGLHSSEAHAKYLAHLEWYVRHHPEAKILRTFCFGLPNSTPGEYAKFEQLWEAQIKLRPNDARVYGNAGYFLHYDEESIAVAIPPTEEGTNEEDFAALWSEMQAKRNQDELQVIHWFLQAQRLDSRNSEWPERLGDVYKSRIIEFLLHNDEADIPEAGKHALQFYEQAFQLIKVEAPRDVLLKKMSMSAYEAGDDAKANQYAMDLLKRVDGPDSKEDHKDDEHYADMILGRLALKRGDVKGAEMYLLAAGTSVGDATHIFGPHMALAVDMLAHGLKDAVLAYLELCSKFWHKEKINQWILQIKDGQIPDFGIQRFY